MDSTPRVVVHLGRQGSRSRSVTWVHYSPTPSANTCSWDTTCGVWFRRDGQSIGASRTTRTIDRRLRRALEYRHPGLCGTGLLGHPRPARPPHPALGRRRPHRAGQPRAAVPLSSPAAPPRRHHHHRTRPRLTVTDSHGRPLSCGSLARPPNRPPPDVPPYPGPLGERAHWKWYPPLRTTTTTEPPTSFPQKLLAKVPHGSERCRRRRGRVALQDVAVAVDLASPGLLHADQHRLLALRRKRLIVRVGSDRRTGDFHPDTSTRSTRRSSTGAQYARCAGLGETGLAQASRSLAPTTTTGSATVPGGAGAGAEVLVGGGELGLCRAIAVPRSKST